MTFSILHLFFSQNICFLCSNNLVHIFFMLQQSYFSAPINDPMLTPPTVRNIMLDVLLTAMSATYNMAIEATAPPMST